MSRRPAAGSAAAAAGRFARTRSVAAKSAGRTAWTCSVKRESVASTPAATPCAASIACWPAWRPVSARSAPTRMIQTPKNSPATTARASTSTTRGRSVRTGPGSFTMTLLGCSCALLRCGMVTDGHGGNGGRRWQRGGNHVPVTLRRAQTNHCRPSAPDSGSARIGSPDFGRTELQQPATEQHQDPAEGGVVARQRERGQRGRGPPRGEKRALHLPMAGGSAETRDWPGAGLAGQRQGQSDQAIGADGDPQAGRPRFCQRDAGVLGGLKRPGGAQDRMLGRGWRRQR